MWIEKKIITFNKEIVNEKKIYYPHKVLNASAKKNACAGTFIANLYHTISNAKEKMEWNLNEVMCLNEII